MPQSNNNAGRGSPPGMPRWVKVLGVLFIVLIVVFVALHLLGVGLGDHGPGRHIPAILHTIWPA